MTVLFFFSGRTSDVQRQHHLQQHDLFHLFDFFFGVSVQVMAPCNGM